MNFGAASWWRKKRIDIVGPRRSLVSNCLSARLPSLCRKAGRSFVPQGVSDSPLGWLPPHSLHSEKGRSGGLISGHRWDRPEPQWPQLTGPQRPTSPSTFLPPSSSLPSFSTAIVLIVLIVLVVPSIGVFPFFLFLFSLPFYSYFCFRFLFLFLFLSLFLFFSFNIYPFDPLSLVAFFILQQCAPRFHLFLPSLFAPRSREKHRKHNPQRKHSKAGKEGKEGKEGRARKERTEKRKEKRKEKSEKRKAKSEKRNEKRATATRDQSQQTSRAGS